MLCKCLITTTTCFFFILSVFAQTSVDPNDEVLLFYKLTQDQRNQFSTSDGLISNFWDDDWGDKDFIDMNTELNSYPERDDWDGLDGWSYSFDILEGVQEPGIAFYARIYDWAGNWIGTGAWNLKPFRLSLPLITK